MATASWFIATQIIISLFCVEHGQLNESSRSLLHNINACFISLFTNNPNRLQTLLQVAKYHETFHRNSILLQHSHLPKRKAFNHGFISVSKSRSQTTGVSAQHFTAISHLQHLFLARLQGRARNASHSFPLETVFTSRGGLGIVRKCGMFHRSLS